MKPKTGEPSWRWRRTATFLMIAYCMGGLAGMVDRADTELNGTIASGLMWLLGVTFLGYAGFATAQDVAAIIAARSGLPYKSDDPTIRGPPDDVQQD